MSSNKLVTNKSKAGSGAYSYNYASLADIVEQGFDIPEMRVKPIFTPDGTTYVGDYMEYKDKDGNWQLGSRIIDAELKGQNAQQSRGSSETYARRYTTLMALQIAGQDDKSIEGAENAGKSTATTRLDFDAIRSTLDAIDDEESLNAYGEDIKKKYPSMTAKQAGAISAMFNKKREELKQ